MAALVLLALLTFSAGTASGLNRERRNAVCPSCATWGYVLGSTSQPFGPFAWGQIPGSQCNGQRQSPIDINAGLYDPNIKLDPLTAPTISPSTVLQHTGQELRLFNTGRPGSLGTVPWTFRGRQWLPFSVSFRTPSAHSINLNFADMEYTYEFRPVNADPTDTSTLRLSVLADISTTTASNPEVSRLFDAVLARGVGSSVPASNFLFSANVRGMLPSNLDFFYYQGSQLTPPCSQNVEWIVLTSRVPVTNRSVFALRQSLQNATSLALGPGNATSTNARPLTPPNGRTVGFASAFGNLPFPSATTPSSIVGTSGNDTQNLTLLLVGIVLVLFVVAGLLVAYQALKHRRTSDNQMLMQPME